MNIEPATILISPEFDNKTLAAILKQQVANRSWSQIHRLIETRRVQIDDSLCLDPARRVHIGETVQILAQPVRIAAGSQATDIKIRHLDDHLVVVEKIAGLNTVRHPKERQWDERRRELSPTLEDRVQQAIRLALKEKSLPRLRIVHRLDKETSGLVVFARSVLSERILGKQFHDHTVLRRYIAIVPGRFASQTLTSWFIRDRGDGKRGSSITPGNGKKAVTHVEVLEYLPRYTVLSCRLETGRTHQIRIHLAEAGHPVCGDRVYGKPDSTNSPQTDRIDHLPGKLPSRAITPRKMEPMKDALLEDIPPRLALHASELGFIHPETGTSCFWEMPLPEDLTNFLHRLRKPSLKSK